MKTKSLIYLASATVLALTLTLGGCKKKHEEQQQPATVDNEQGSSSDNTFAETTVNDIGNMASQGVENGSLTTYKGMPGSGGMDIICTSSCATITFGTKTFTIDFGSTACLCTDGRYRSGKLMFDYTGSASGANYYRNPGFKCVITSQNYVVDSYTVNIINKSITNTTPNSIPTGTNPGTNLTWSVSANVSIVKPSNGGTITWNGSRTHTLLNTNDPNCYKGQTMPIDWTKAKVQTSGSASGTTASNESFSSSLSNVVRDMTCTPDITRPHRHPFISGTLVFTPGSRPTRTIDFGAGTCDFGATLTVNGTTYTFNLP